MLKNKYSHLIRFKSINLQLLSANPTFTRMNSESIQNYSATSEKFQKYPKNYQENHHYKSVKQKLMTAQDDQDIIQFPYTTSLQTRISTYQFTPASSNRKLSKFKGKKFATVPLRTISYSTPPNPVKNQQFIHSSKTSRKSDSQNKFASKNLFTNMKKLKDLRKTNYKNRITSMQRKQQPQKPTDSNDNLDLFKLTSTNFKYKERMFSDCTQDLELFRKLTQTQGTSRNVIKYQKPKKCDQKDQIGELKKATLQIQSKNNPQSQFFILNPVKTQQAKSVEKAKPKKLIKTASVRNMVSKHRISDCNVRNLIDEQKVSHQNALDFVRYSESMIETDNEVFRNGIAKLRQIGQDKHQDIFKKSNFQHIPQSFRTTFRVKHIDDNKNILLNTIKKKANLMDRNELVEYLKKVVK